MERRREDLLGNPQAVGPLVERNLDDLGHRRSEQKEKGPGKSLARTIGLGNPIAPVEVHPEDQHDRHREAVEEHWNVARRECRIPHHRLMPRTIQIRVETCHPVQMETDQANLSPKNGNPPHLFLVGGWLVQEPSS